MLESVRILPEIGSGLIVCCWRYPTQTHFTKRITAIIEEIAATIALENATGPDKPTPDFSLDSYALRTH
jgi:hypothetical protein